MIILETLFVIIYGLVALFGGWLGYKKCRFEKNNLGLTPSFYVFGAFVWADMVIFGPFWFLFSIFSLFLQDFTLFLLGFSLFWVVRSVGETIYWFNQQFSEIKRSTHADFFFSKLFNDDDYVIWFVMQISMQCITVVALLSSLYFGKIWLTGF